MTLPPVFKTMAEVMSWAREQFPGSSFSVQHLEADRYVVIVKGNGKVIQRQVVYVRWEQGE